MELPYVRAGLALLCFATLAYASTLRRPLQTPSDHAVSALVITTKGEVNHAFWMRRLYGVEVSAREAACARNGSVLYAQSGACEQLFEQGPCSAREWLVVQSGGLRGQCRARPCAPGYGFLADEGRCAPDAQLCADCRPDRLVFRYSARGEGRWHCPGFRARGPDGACHVLYSRGPCRQGQILVPSYSQSLDAARGVCVTSTCPEGELRVVTESTWQAAGGQCTPVGDLECSAMMVALMGPKTDVYVPLCDDPIRFAFKVPTKPASCVTNNKGACVRSVVRSLQPYDWSVAAEEDDDKDKIVFEKSAATDFASTR